MPKEVFFTFVRKFFAIVVVMKVLSFLAMMVASAAAVPGGWIAAGHHESRIAREAEDTASNAALGVQSRTEQ